MPRANLGQLLGNVDDFTPPLATADPRQRVETSTEKVAIKALRSERVAPEGDPTTGGATYLRFVRKDTRLRDDQLEALTAHARRLNRKRRSVGSRVTENTLIRVAVDLLLGRIEGASGDDEAALLESVR